MEEKQLEQEKTPTPSSDTKQYAGFWIRLLAYIIDGAIASGISYTLAYSLSKTFDTNGALNLIIPALYFILFWVLKSGQTLGMQLMAIRVVRVDGKPIEWGTAVLRYIGYIISGLVFGLGFFWIGWDPKKQGWHDKIASTYVVKTGEKPKTWLAVLLALVLFVIFAGLISLIIFGAATMAYKNPNELPASLKNLVPTSTQQESSQLSNNVFTGLNNYRISKGLPEIKGDSQTCAYATRRMDAFNQRGEYDNGKGFYEDMGNSQIVNSYFSPTSHVSESFRNINSLTNSEDIVKSLTNDTISPEKKIAFVNDPKTTLGCVLSNSKYIVIIGATK